MAALAREMTSGGKNLRQLHEPSPSLLAYGKVARELPVAAAQLIRLELAHEPSLDPQKRLIKPHVCVIWRHQESKAWWQTEKFLNERTPFANVRRV